METLEERIIAAWVRLTGALKNTRITQCMNYNEAIVMNLVVRKYKEDGVGLVSFKEIASETRMLKSLVNRTIDALVERGCLERLNGTDKRTTFVKPADLDSYFEEHGKTLALVRDIVGIIGPDDAEAFIRISDKICSADPLHES